MFSTECTDIKEVIIKYHIPLDEKLHSELKGEGGGGEREGKEGGGENLSRLPMFQYMLTFSCGPRLH